MKRKRPSRTDILASARQAAADLAAGVSIEEICSVRNVSLETLKRWLREYAAATQESTPRIVELERENRRLQKTVAALERDKLVLSAALQGNF